MTIVTRVCAIVSDLLVITITWRRTYAMKREADRLHIKASLASLLLRDGTIYFVCVPSTLLAESVLIHEQGPPYPQYCAHHRRLLQWGESGSVIHMAYNLSLCAYNHLERRLRHDLPHPVRPIADIPVLMLTSVHTASLPSSLRASS